MAFSNK
jgi:hypothetical protein